MMESVGNPPRETVIIGVEPAEVDWGLELTPTLRGEAAGRRPAGGGGAGRFG